MGRTQLAYMLMHVPSYRHAFMHSQEDGKSFRERANTVQGNLRLDAKGDWKIKKSDLSMFSRKKKTTKN